jgi:hypothetical protein
VYEVADRPAIGGGRWDVLPDDSTFFLPTEGALRPSSITAHTLRDHPAWVEPRHFVQAGGLGLRTD